MGNQETDRDDEWGDEMIVALETEIAEIEARKQRGEALTSFEEKKLDEYYRN